MQHESLRQHEINLYQDATNVVECEDFYQVLEATCAKIYDTLRDHCGPYATDALLIQGHDDSVKVDAFRSIFSKDGIDIVNSIRFVSPIQVHIKNLIAYVGSRVDAVSKDGTTTAMMLFTDALRSYAAALKDTKPKDRAKVIRSVLTMVRDVIRENTITVKSLIEDYPGLTEGEAKRFIAWNQAMISSKGDHEIADAITEVVMTLTPEMYSQFTIDQSRVETDKRITVDIDEFQYSLDATITNNDLLNHRLRTEFLSESCDLMVESNQLIQGNPVCELIKEIISDDHPPLERDLVILCDSADTYLTTAIHKYNVTHEHKVIIFCRLNGGMVGNTSATLDAIRAMAGVYSPGEFLANMGDKELPYVIQNVKVHYKHLKLQIDRLYDPKGQAYHPYYSDPDAFLPYTKLLRTLKEQLEEYENGHRKGNGAEDYRVMHLTRIYQRMMCTKVARLEISGTTHDSLADYSVVKDAFGAVLSSLSDGFVLDGLGTMLAGLEDRRTKLRLSCDQTADGLSPMIKVLENVIRVVHDIPATTTKQVKRPYFGYKTITVGTDVPMLPRWAQQCTYCFHLAGVDALLTLDWIGKDGDGLGVINADTKQPTDHTALIQPAKGYLELCRRLEELLPKILNTTRVIIPNKFNLADVEE